MELRSTLLVLFTMVLASCKPQAPPMRLDLGPLPHEPGVIAEAQLQPETPPPWLRTAGIKGKILGPTGPLAAAEVQVWAQLGRGTLDLGLAHTDVCGEYHVAAVPPGAIILQVASAGFATARTTLWAEDGDNQAPQLSLQPEALVAGKVLGNAGQPVVGATIRASSVTQPDLQLQAASDPQGKFTIEGLAQGRVALAAEAPGYQLAASPETEAPARGVILRLSRVFELQGTVRGLPPAAKAAVWLAGSGVWPARQAAVATGSGRFVFAGLPEGVYELVARTVSEPWRASKVLAEVVIGPEQPREVRLTLEPAYRLAGTVARGETPVPGATVVASGERLAVLQDHVVTDEEGRFFLSPVPRGTYYLSVWAKGYLPELGKEIRVPAGDFLRLTLELGAHVSGIAVDGDGYPVAGAVIRAIYRSGGETGKMPPGPLGELGVMPGPVPPIPPAALSRQPQEALGPASLTALTDREGRFVLRGLSPGSLRLMADHPDYLAAASGWLEGQSGGSLPEVRLELSAGGRLQGTVSDSRGSALAGVEVVAQGAKEARTALTDEGGRFALSGLERRVRVSATRPGFLLAEQALELPPGKLRTLDLVLTPADGQVAGMVRDGFGVPLPGVRVEAVRGEHRRRGVTGADGSFQLQGTGQPPFELVAERKGYAPVRLRVGDSDALEITLHQLVQLGGQVLEQRAGTGIVDYQLQVHGQGIKRETRVRDAAGRFVLSSLPPGRLTLTVKAAGYVSQQQVVELTAASAAPGFPPQELRFELQPAGSAFGQLTDAGGAVVAGAEIRLAGRQTLTDATGGFQLEELPEGTHPLEVVTLARGAVSLDPVIIRAREASGPLRLVLP